MHSKKDQLEAKYIPYEVQHSLVIFFHVLAELSLCSFIEIKQGQVIHFCKRHMSHEYKREPPRW